MKLQGLAKVLRDDCALNPRDRLILGVSGGPDSLALLHALHSLGYRPVVAHLDHALRPESAQDAQAVKKQAEALDLPFRGRRADVAARARKASKSIEEAAREERYRFLFALAEEASAPAVAVAHTADDQVETVLMHLLRGAGSAGLSGMETRSLPNPWSERIPLVRPLLGIWRSEIEAYCQEKDLKPLVDASNLDITYFRNRLRHALIPDLQSYNPEIKRALYQTAEVLRADRGLLENLAEGAWQAVLRRQGDGYLGLSRRGLLEQPLALQRMLLRRAFAVLRPAARDLDFESVQRALQSLERKTSSSRQDWAAGLYHLVEGELFWLANWDAELPADWPQLSPRVELRLELPAVLDLDKGWRLSAKPVPDAASIRARALGNQDPFQAWLDFEHTGGQLTLRTRRPGDRFQPLGLESGSQKLADFMINARMPERARAAWPLVCRESEILWVPGLRIAHPYRLVPDTASALHLRVNQSTASG